MNKIREIAVLFLVLGLICGCGSTTSSSSDGGDGGSDSSTGFTISGTLSSTNVSLSKSLSSGTITDIVAVSPETGGASCKKASVGSNGTFNIKIEGKKPWFLYFLDSAKRGMLMFMGRLSPLSSTLTTFTPASTTGSSDVGTVTVDTEDGVAESSKTEGEITNDLGLDSTTVDTIKSSDGVARRYGNPDMDNDGAVDCNSETETDAAYFLDFHIRFDMKTSGVSAKVTDILDAYLSDSMAPSYNSTGIYVAYLTSYSSATSGTVTFTDSDVTTEEGGTITANTPTSDVTLLDDFGNYRGWGVNLPSSAQTYAGGIEFAFGDKTLTFPDIQMPTLAQIQAPTGRIFPFIRFNRTDPACTSNCTIASLEYKWMKKTETGWTPASLSEVALLVKSGGIGFRYALDSASTRYINYSFSTEKLSDSVTWSPSNFSLENVSDSEFQNLYTSQICHIGLSHDDKLGFRYFQNIYNADGTCS